MKNYKVTIKEASAARTIHVIARGWYEALLIVRPQINAHAACRVIVRPA